MKLNMNYEFGADTLEMMMEDSSLNKTKKEYLLKYSDEFRATYYELRNVIWTHVFHDGKVVKEALFNKALSGEDMFGTQHVVTAETGIVYRGTYYLDLINKLMALSSESKESIYSSIAEAFQKELNRIASNLEFSRLIVKDVMNDNGIDKYVLLFDLRDTRTDLY